MFASKIKIKTVSRPHMYSAISVLRSVFDVESYTLVMLSMYTLYIYHA
jgi:hypothetical protein